MRAFTCCMLYIFVVSVLQSYFCCCCLFFVAFCLVSLLLLVLIFFIFSFFSAFFVGTSLPILLEFSCRCERLTSCWFTTYHSLLHTLPLPFHFYSFAMHAVINCIYANMFHSPTTFRVSVCERELCELFTIHIRTIRTFLYMYICVYVCMFYLNAYGIVKKMIKNGEFTPFAAGRIN